jgi:hypothetical protein
VIVIRSYPRLHADYRLAGNRASDNEVKLRSSSFVIEISQRFLKKPLP